MAKPVIPVTAAIIVRRGKVFIARRADKGDTRGKWEFPGGKIEPGETPEECLARELNEEFGVRATVGDLFIEHEHDYGARVVRLMVFRVTKVTGRFVPTEHSAMAWVCPAELSSYDLAPADIPVAERFAAVPRKN
ncbi:MAG TPA: 8-oxo-dGTP diphosphatase MutT [bacterium]|nr:8-oxo-dGTP diphosphatase MutT [bacterium]